MKPLTQGVTEAILKAAQEEFLEYGFLEASLRRISAACNVSTHTIYTRFGDKAGLFEALVGEVAEAFFNSIKKMTENAEENGENSVGQQMDFANDGTIWVLEYIYQYFDVFKLILCKSSGTKYENYLVRLSKMEAASYKKIIPLLLGENSGIDDFFIDQVCATGYEYLASAVKNDLTFEEAKKFMEKIMKFQQAGWEEMLEK